MLRRDLPLHRLLVASQLLVDDNFVVRNRLRVKFRQRGSVGELHQNVLTPRLRIGIGGGERLHLLRRATQHVHRGCERRIILRRLRRICGSDLGPRHPQQRLIAELRMLLQRIERSSCLRVFLELHIANARAELCLRNQQRLRILLRKRRECRRRIRQLPFVESEHCTIKLRTTHVLRHLIHERFERSLLLRFQRCGILQRHLRRFLLLLVSRKHRLVSLRRSLAFAAEMLRATEQIARMNTELLRERRE